MQQPVTTAEFDLGTCALVLHHFITSSALFMLCAALDAQGRQARPLKSSKATSPKRLTPGASCLAWSRSLTRVLSALFALANGIGTARRATFQTNGLAKPRY
jgi:hypothetical protein